MTGPYQLFDALPAHIEAALRASVERFGVLVPVTVDQHGAMLDGHHRARIADELGVPYDRLVRHCADDDERREIARTLNADRRQLDEEQRRPVAVELRQQGHSYRAIGGALGVSDWTVRNDVKEEERLRGTSQSPDRVIRQGGGSYPARRPQVYARDEREQEAAQQALVQTSYTMPDGLHSGLPERPLIASEAVKLAARQREPQAVPEPIPPPPGKYRCIVIDPPWPMQKIERDERPNQGVALDYPVMPIECQSPEIVGRKTDRDTEGDEQAEPIYSPCFKAWWSDDDDYDDGWQPCRSIECVVGHTIRTSALDDCHIYLWVTHKYLPAGLGLLNAWGFNYQCVMTWRKNVGITPFSWMYDTEHVLFGRCGNLPLDRLGLRLSFEAPVQGHSVKPDAFYERVARASPGPRVDMFARSHRDGFTSWGNEVADVV